MISETIGGARHFDANGGSRVKQFFSRFCAVVGSRRYLFAIAALLVGSQSVWATTSINHQFSPSVVNQGDTSLYTITVTNDSITPLTGAKATIFLDNTAAAPNVALGHITIASGTVVSNTCGFTGVTAVAADNKIVLTGGTIGAGTLGTPYQCTFALNVTATTVGTYLAVFPATTTPSATVTGYEATEDKVVVQNATPASISLQVNALSPPTGGKSYSPSPAIAGDPTTLTITLSNPNAGSTMPLTSFIDALPAGMKVASTPAASVNCTGTGAVNGTFAPGADDTTLTLTGGTIGQSGTCVLSVKVIVPNLTPSNTAQTYANNLAGGAIGNTRGLSSPAFNQNLTVNTPIAVSKSFNPTTIPAGQPSLMTITITNNSTANTLPISSFADDLTASSLKVLNTASSPVAAVANPSVVCDGTGAANGALMYTPDVTGTSLTLANAVAGPQSGGNGKCVITAYVTASVDGTRTNSIAAGAVTSPTGHQSPAASANLAVNGQLTVDKAVTVNSVAPGQWTQFMVTIRNYSGGTANVSFVDNLPNVTPTSPAVGGQMVLEGVNPVSSTGCTGGTWSGVDGASSLSWSGGTIAAGVGASPGLCTIVFKARLPSSATTSVTFTNQIPASDGSSTGVWGTCSGTSCSVGDGGALTNPSASPAVNVTAVDSVAMTKAFSPTSIAQGGLSTMTLTLRNRTLLGLTAINLTDNFPAGLTLAANPAAVNNCGGALQAFPGDNRLVLTGGTVAARPDASTDTTCTVTVKVTSTTLGGAPDNQNTIATTDLSTSGGTIASAVSATLTVTTGIASGKAFSPSSVTPGGKARATITVNNTSNGDLTNVGINDNTFVGLTVANPANAATSCAGSPTLVANPGATSAQLQGATLNAGASCTLSFDVQTSGATPWSNTVPVGGITSAEGVSNTAAVTASLTSVGGAININKSFSPVIVTGGVPSTLTITLTNPTASVLHGVGFTDVFPSGIQVYSVPDVTSTCAGGTVTAVSGVGQMSLTGATMAANSSCAITLQVTSVKFLNLTNVIGAGAVVSAEGYTNPSAVSATLTTLQGLGVMKAFSPAYVVPNAVSRLKMQLVSTYDANAPTPLTLTGVTYTDTLPAGVLVAPAPNPTTTCVGAGAGGYANITANAGAGKVVVSGATIAPGSNCTIEVDVVAPAVLGTYTNLIVANSITTEQGPTNSNPATAKLHVVALPTLSKAFAPITVSVGANSTLKVTINNGAGVDLTGVGLADNLPSGVTIAGTPAASTTCNNASVTANPGAGVLAISGATVPAGGACTFQADVFSLTAGSYANTIAANALTSNESLTNPGAVNATLLVRSTPTLSKTFSPVSILANGTSTLTITLGNSNASAITLSSDLVDALPGNVVIAATPAKAGTCIASGGGINADSSVTAVAGETSITFASGASIPTGGCTIVVDVTSPSEGTYTNVIAASQLDTSAGKNQDPAFASLAVGAGALVPPTVSKSFSPGTIDISGTSTLTILLGNANGAALTLNSNLVDTLPSNVVVAASPTIGGTCTSGSVTAVAGSGTVTYVNTASIPAGGCTITVNVTSASPGIYTNTIAAGAVQTNAGNNVQPATAGLVVASPIPPTVTKSFSPNTINPAGVSRLTITLGNSNAGSITLSSVFTDTLPTGVVVAATPNVGGSCTGSIAASGGGNTVTYASGASVPAGGCTISVDVTASSSAGSPYTNTIAASTLVTNAGANGAPATDRLFVNPPQPPSVSKSFSPAVIPKNGTSTLTISLGNGNLAQTTLTEDFTDTLPTGVVVATAPNVRTGSNVCTGTVVATSGANTVVYKSGGAIPAGGCTISVDVTSATPAIYTNTILANTLTTGYGKNAVESKADLQVLAWPTVADLVTTKAINPGSGAPGDEQTVTLTWKNASAATPIQNMYQCAVSDPLPAAAFDLTANPASAVTTPAGYTFSQSGNTVTYTRTDINTPCETALQTATFKVKLKVGIVTGSTYINTATTTARTLPANDANYSTTCATLSNCTITKDASANVVVSGPVASAKTVTATSQDFTDPSETTTTRNANPPVAIGETVTYSIPFNLQPGVTKSVTLVDEITSGIGDVALVSATLQKSSTGLSAVSDPASINAAAINTPVTVSLTSGGALPANEFQLALGNVTNTDSAAATYTLTITLRVANAATNTAGHTIADQGRIRYKNVADTDLTVVTSATKSVHVALPVVQITKSASPAAPAGGGTVTYTLTIKNNSTDVNAAAGYDWTFTDTLPAELTSPGSFTVTGNAGTHTVNGSFTGNTLNGTIDQLAPGESVVATYTATVATGTAFGKAITNSATATATTIPSASTDDAAGRRTGDATGANNLRATTSATVTTGKPTMTKTVEDAQTYYSIGDLVHYQITVAVPVGTTSAFTITDALPAGLAYYSATAPTWTLNNVSVTGTVTPTATSPLTFTLGNITATTAGSVVIDFYAQVTNVHTNQNNTSITNVANASYTNPAGGAALTLTASAAAITVGEPNLTMTKTIVSGATGSDAGSTVRWQFTVANANTVAAYQQTIRDQLPDHLNNISIVSVTPTGNVYPNVAGCGTGTAVGAANAVVSTTTNTNDTLTIAGICMAPGTTLTVQYDTTVMNTAVAAEVLTNTVRSNYASQAAGTSGSAVVRDGADANTDDDTDPTATCDGSSSTKKCNNYNDSASGALTISAAIAIDKQADRTQATIGELVTYTLKVSVIEGVTPTVVVSDILPAGLTYVSHTISLGHVGMSLGNASYATREGTGQTVQFTLGNVVNDADADATNDFVTVAITARVDNIAANQKGTILKNGEGTGAGQTTPTVTVKYGSTPVTVGYDYNTTTATGYQGRPLTVIEPALKLTKTAVPVAQSLGDEVFFTLSIAHDGANSNADAFDLQVTDTLPTGLTYVNGSASTPPSSVVGQTLTFPVIASLTQAQTANITYRAKVDSAAVVGTALLNTAAVTWKGLTGATGAADNGRTGPLSGGDTLNDYKASNTASVTPTTSAFISAQKTVAIHVDQNSDGIANPGETLRYTVTLVNSSSTTAATNVLFSDTIPANATYVNSSLTLGGSAATNSGSSTQLSLNVGNMAANATVTITFDVTINTGTAAGTIISNQGQVDSDQTVPKPTDEDGNPANGDQPTTIPVGGSGAAGALYSSKYVGQRLDADASGSNTAGDTMRYTLFVRNSGGTPLTGVVLKDPIPSGLTAISTPGAGQGTIAANAGTVTWNIGNLSVGQIVSGYFDVTIDNFSGSRTFSNQGSVSSATSGVTTVQTDGNGDPADGAQPTVFDAGTTPVPKLDVQKRWSLSVDADNNGFPSQGDSLRYSVSITNTGATTATDVRLSDAAPTCSLGPTGTACTSLIAGSVAASPGIVLAEGPPVSVNIGSLTPGQTATVSWRVSATAANGNVIANQASVTAANVTGGPTLSDNDGVPDNGINPTLTPLDNGTTGLAAPSNLAKTLYATDQAGSTGANVLIGEIATWRVSINVPPGNTRSLTLTDTLPAHLALVAGSGRLFYTSVSALSATANPGGINNVASNTSVALDSTALVATANGDGTTTLTLALGNINNSATTTGSSYTLEFQSKVSNVDANVSTQTRTNRATASFLNSLGQPMTLTPVTASVTIVEPVLTVTLTNSPAALLPVGGPVAFTSVLTNTSAVPASDVTLNIPLPTGFTAAASVVVSSTGSCATVVGSPTTTGTPPVVGVTIGSMPAGCVVTATFTGTAGNTLTSGSTLSTTATTRWTSLPGDVTGERTGSGTAPDNYDGEATASILVNDLSLTKALTTTATRYAIGDTVGYKLTLSVPGPFGPISDVQLSDILPVGLVYTGSSSATDTSGVTSLNPSALSGTGVAGDPLILNLGTVNNTVSIAKEVVVTFDARVTNVAGNQDGTTWPNFGTLSFKDPATGSDVTPRNSPSVSITVGEPNLLPTLTAVTTTTNLNAGNTVTYEYVASNNGMTVMHDLVLANTLPAALTNVQGLTVVSVTDSGTPGDATAASGITLSGTGTNAWTSSPFTLGVGDSVTIRYTVTLANTVQPGVAIQNTVIGTFTSRAGVDANERSGSTTGPIETDTTGSVDNYRADAVSPAFTSGDSVSFTKAFLPSSTTQYAVGATVSYRLTVGMPQGTVKSLVVTDTLPAGLDLVSAKVASFGNGAMTTTGSTTPTWATNGTTLVTWNLGDVVNPADASNNDFIAFDIDARVDNTLTNQAVVTLGNNAAMSFVDGSSVTQTRNFDADTSAAGLQPLNLTIVEPVLALAKSANVTTMSLGDTVRFSMLVDHLPASGSDAFDVTVVDVLPIGLTYVNASSSLSPAVTTLGDGRQQLVFAVGTLTKTSDNTTVTYDALVSTAAVVGTPLTNNATLTWASQPSPGGTGAADSGRNGKDGVPASGILNDYQAQSSTSISPNANTIYTTKTVALVADAMRLDVVDVGDTLQYTVVLHNGSTALTNVLFTDTLPANTSYVANSLTLGGLAVSNAGSNTVLGVNVGAMAANATATITFRVTVNAATPPNTVISNQGSVDSDQTVPKPTDEDGNPANGDQPTTIAVGPQMPVPGLQVQKSSYLGHSLGAGCATGQNPLVVVDASHASKNITWCFTVTNNTDSAYLASPVFTDAGLGIAPADQSRVHLAYGVLPLAPGASAIWYVEDARITSLVNTVTASLTPTDAAGRTIGLPDISGTTGSAAVFAYVFDPPFGIKTGVVNGFSLVRWNMVWINDNAISADGVEITDPPPVGMSFAGNLVCTPQGSTTVSACAFEAASAQYPRGRVRVVANIGADLGATNESSAKNALLIAFDATVDNPALSQTLRNQGKADWTPPGGTVLTANTNAPIAGGGPTNVPFVVSAAGIPTLSQWGLLVLAMMLVFVTRAFGLTRR